MKDGFLKAAALSPALRVADCAYNVRQITEALRKAAARGVKLAVFPEFCLTGYTCGDLFLQRTLQTGALDALSTLLDETKALDVVTLVGLPLLVHGKLYNCAAAARCPALCWVWRSARICGAPCRPPLSTRWPVRP